MHELGHGGCSQLSDMPVIKLRPTAEVGGVKDDGLQVRVDTVAIRLQEDRAVPEQREEKFEDLEKLNWSELCPSAKLYT